MKDSFKNATSDPRVFEKKTSGLSVPSGGPPEDEIKVDAVI